MGITRDSRHKHRLTGGRVNVHKKKRKYEMGRPSAMTKLGRNRVKELCLDDFSESGAKNTATERGRSFSTQRFEVSQHTVGQRYNSLCA